MSWLDAFFDAVGQAPIVTTFGPAPQIGITPATPSAAGSMSAADKSKLDGLGAQVAGGVVAPAVPGAGTTPVTLFTFAIPTGYDALVSFDLLAKITGGSGVSGHTGQRWAGKFAQLYVNPSGTPALSSGTAVPSTIFGYSTPYAYWGTDEASSFLQPTLSATYAANSVTVQAVGLANVNIDWSAVVTSISLLKE